jgi:hypothetical protein
MKKYLLSMFAVLLLSGCAGPKFSVKPINEENKLKEVTVVKDDATREIFLDTIETWCLDTNHECNFVADRSKHVPEELTLNYISRWSWDFRTYIADAKIKAYKNNKLVGEVSFKAPNTLDTNKFGNDDQRIETMMQLLFGLMEVSDANQMLSSGGL